MQISGEVLIYFDGYIITKAEAIVKEKCHGYQFAAQRCQLFLR